MEFCQTGLIGTTVLFRVVVEVNKGQELAPILHHSTVALIVPALSLRSKIATRIHVQVKI